MNFLLGFFHMCLPTFMSIYKTSSSSLMKELLKTLKYNKNKATEDPAQKKLHFQLFINFLTVKMVYAQFCYIQNSILHANEKTLTS